MAKIVKLTFLLAILSSGWAVAQERPIQMSGVVFEETNDNYGLYGTNIFVPERRQGTTTNQYGYYSIPVLPGDSIVFSYVGLKTFSFVVPEDQKEDFSYIVYLGEDPTYLPTLEVTPYLSEERFKEAVLYSMLPEQGVFDRMNENLNDDIMASMRNGIPLSGTENYNYYMSLRQANSTRGVTPQFYNPLLNPFAWAEVIRSLRRDR